MKFFSTALLALPALSFALPTQNKRQVSVTSVVTEVEGLLGQVMQYTGAINTTISATTVGQDVSVDVTQQLQSIVSAVEQTVQTTGALTIADSVVSDVEQVVGGVVAAILAEVGSTLKLVDETISLGPIMNEVNGLTSALSGLIGALESLGLTNIVGVIGQVGGGVLNVVGAFLPGLPF